MKKKYILLNFLLLFLCSYVLCQTCILTKCESGQIACCDKCYDSSNTDCCCGSECCSSNQYCDELEETCVDCPILNCSPGFCGTISGECSQTKDCVCSSGYYCSNNNCTLCPAGTYSNAGSSSCILCSSGTYSNAGSSSCILCSSGTYSNAGSSNCIPCPKGTYSSSSGSSNCISCPAGTFSDKIGQINSSTCIPCSEGTFSLSGSSSCTPCSAGAYSKSNFSICLNCPIGSYSKSGSSSCTECPKGTFSNTTGSISCIECPAGTFSNTTGSISCIECPNGTFSILGSENCSDCPIGTYSSSIKSTKCSQCPSGTYSNITRASFCLFCPKGMTSNSFSTQCILINNSNYNKKIFIGSIIGGVGLLSIGAVLFLYSRNRKKKNIPNEINCNDKISYYSELPSISSNIVFGQHVIKYSELKIIKKIGSGAFGDVYFGELRKTAVAIKYLKKHIEEDINKFISEAVTMKDVPVHPNVVMFRGITIPPDPISIITDYCDGGSLYDLLHSGTLIEMNKKIQFVVDIAKGMLHLHYGLKEKQVIHRDLAARNILLKNGIAQISDFGMSRMKSYIEDAKKTKTDIGPIKWMAPECFTKKEYSIKSDVFSYGVLIYEIITQKDPWEDEDSLIVAQKVMNGERMIIPYYCPIFLSKLMQICWKQNPDERFDFYQIYHYLEQEAKK